ncbi:MAG: ABC transporter substrate-binding protein [Bryobacteraceae bacterium]|jgi:ABC-type branched-subunit amino acid transport system substrate-binding protein
MKRIVYLVGGLVGMAALLVCADEAAERMKKLQALIDPDTAEVLKRINAVDAYTVPDLKLKREENFAKTPADTEPYSGVKPYKEFFLLQTEYTGPGRAILEPGPELKTVKIGFIGPIVNLPSVNTGGMGHEATLGKMMLKGAQMALDEANEGGGYLRRGIPFELKVVNDNGLWGSSGNEITNMAYKDPVWAILGTIDGANSHVAIRVALKTETLIMNSGDTDPTFTETNIPWTARCIGDDRQMGYLMADYLFRKLGMKRVALIRSSNRFGRFGIREVRDLARRLGHPVLIEMAYRVGTDDLSMQVERLKAVNPDAVVHWGDARESAVVLNTMRTMGMKQPFFANDRTVSDEFTKLAGANAEGTISVFPWNPDRKDPKLTAFRERFHKRFGEEPETYAAHGYDGMNMLIWATQVGGLNRAKIRDLIAYRTKPWPGVTGDIPLSSTLDDLGDVFLAKFEQGKWSYHSREEWQIPQGYIPPRSRVARELEAEGQKQ